MKIFRTARERMILSGIAPNHVSIGLYELKHISSYMLGITLTFLHSYYGGGTLTQYTESILMILMVMLVFVGYLTFKLNTQAVYKMFHGYEQIINASESKLQNLSCA